MSVWWKTEVFRTYDSSGTKNLRVTILMGNQTLLTLRLFEGKNCQLRTGSQRPDLRAYPDDSETKCWKNRLFFALSPMVWTFDALIVSLYSQTPRYLKKRSRISTTAMVATDVSLGCGCRVQITRKRIAIPISSLSIAPAAGRVRTQIFVHIKLLPVCCTCFYRLSFRLINLKTSVRVLVGTLSYLLAAPHITVHFRVSARLQY